MSRIRELTRTAPKLGRAYLAEDYDGIGQYVMVALSRGSTSGAYKARVAAGDFGGGRVFPAGTPILAHISRGQIEILDLGNLPHTGFEEFNRDVTQTCLFGPGVVSSSGQFIGTADAGFLWDVLLLNNNGGGDGDLCVTVDGSQLILEGLNAESAGGQLQFRSSVPPESVAQFFDRDVNVHTKFSTVFNGGTGPFISFFIEVNEFSLGYQNVSHSFSLADNALPVTFKNINMAGFPNQGTFHLRARYTRSTSRMEATCWNDTGLEPDPQLIYETSKNPRTEIPDPGFRFGADWLRTSLVTVDYIRLESVT